ncbi:MAG: ABC transporter substrate-binding protein [Rubrivivax sp.]|nr:ABC transporter substrate-binding protein [Rubrivivax sp.]
MNTRRPFILGITASLAAPRLHAQADTVPGLAADSITLGQSIALQSGKNAYATEAQAGIVACLNDANRRGGVFGRRVTLKTLDDDNNAGKAEAHARTLADADVFAFFGSLEGGPSMAVLKVAVERGIPFIGPMAGSPGLRRPHQRLVFPVRAEHREEFRALLQQGHRVGLKKAALMHADSDTGREHLGNVERLCKEIGIGFGGGLQFRNDIDDAGLRQLNREAAERGVDLVFNHGSAGVYEKLIRSARASGSRTVFWGVNSGSTPLARSLGDLAHGMVFAQIVPNPLSGKTALAREYQLRMAEAASNGAPPVLGYGGLEGFMTAKALLVALRAAGPAPTRERLVAAAEGVNSNLGGVSLRWQSGNHTGSAFVDLALVGRDGRFVQ